VLYALFSQDYGAITASGVGPLELKVVGSDTVDNVRPNPFGRRSPRVRFAATASLPLISISASRQPV